MTNEEKFAKFIVEYKETVKTNLNVSDQEKALCLLLEHFSEEVAPGFDHGFHRTFRQIDVTDSGKTDMAIWYLIHASSLFWGIFDKYNPHEG